ncbi:DUF3152 domain-containing protein [Streptomyces sp. NPDC048018]|uniref:DUF3152 domain-containing protein n=1 Tax=Streptomyces sp. NPDC048018 TaxID=3365499 RepID=UPI003721BD37
MGRHSRKGPVAPVADTGQREATGPGPGTGRRRRGQGQEPPAPPQQPAPYDTQGHDTPTHGVPGYGARGQAAPGHGTAPDQRPQGRTAPGRGSAPGYGPRGQAAPAQGPRSQARPPYDTPANGVPGYGPQGRPAPGQGGPRRPAAPLRDTPARGVPAAPAFDTPMHGTPRYQGPHDSATRGGHPVQDEAVPAAPFIPGPRRADRPVPAPADPGARSGETAHEPAADEPDASSPERQPARLGRTLTGIAAAAITTVLAVVVAGQVAGQENDGGRSTSAADESADRVGAASPASRSDERAAPVRPAPAALPTYEQLMARQFPIDPKSKASGEFQAVPGFDRAPGKGRKIRYRVDVEKGLGLDGVLFAQAVQKTLNDPRSWAGRGEMTFERISSGEPEFVITLASPGTTGDWCRKSGLDTTVDNVSCDSASTERVMINAFRWAQGSVTFGPKAMYAYRQMLINHEVGHRLGHGHVSCRTPGALAPVMQQQTKSLDIDDIKCRPNPWVHPGS